MLASPMHQKPISSCKWFNKVIVMILILVPACACAQNNRTEDVVYLKNHFGLTEVHGTFVPAPDSNMVAVRTRDKNVWVFSRSDIEKISREKLIFQLKPHGWYNATSGGIYYGDDKGYQIQSVAGYRFLYRYYAGIGAALDNYTIRSLPVFADLRADWFLKRQTPFTYLDLGISNPWASGKELKYQYGQQPDKNIPGWYVNAGVGQRFRSRNHNHSWEISAGYSLETLTLRYIQRLPSPDPGQTDIAQVNDYHYTFNRLVIRLGFTL